MPSQSVCNYAGPGRYRHYKGNEYTVSGLALDEHDRATLRVIYAPVGEHPGAFPADFWSRPLGDFNEQVLIAGQVHVPRFRRVGDGSA